MVGGFLAKRISAQTYNLLCFWNRIKRIRVALENQGSQSVRKQPVKHKMSGLITRLFCAECLPFARTANYGCYYLGHCFRLNDNSRFVVLGPDILGDYYMKQGFTLIELLVVVLIIGILASVALPQYNKAVMKSRVAALWPTLSALAKAAAVCKMDKGEVCTNLEELDITVPTCQKRPDGNCATFNLGEDNAFAFVGLDNANNALAITPEGQKVCAERVDTPNACKKLGLNVTALNDFLGRKTGFCPAGLAGCWRFGTFYSVD